MSYHNKSSDIRKPLEAYDIMTSTDTEQDLIDMLWQAAKSGDASRIRLLVSRGVDVNIRNKDGWTPLHVATQYGHVEAMRTLISARSMQRMSGYGVTSYGPVTWNETLKKPMSFSESETNAA